jgi:hypothetical protein
MKHSASGDNADNGIDAGSASLDPAYEQEIQVVLFRQFSSTLSHYVT